MRGGIVVSGMEFQTAGTAEACHVLVRVLFAGFGLAPSRVIAVKPYAVLSDRDHSSPSKRSVCRRSLLVGRPLPASRSAGIASGRASPFGAGGGDMSS